MRSQLMIAVAASVTVLVGAVQAQTPAVGASANAATVGQDYTIARQRRMNWEHGLTTGYAGRQATGPCCRVITDRMLPERFAPDAEEAALAGH